MLSGRNTWWMTSTPSPCSVPTRTASPLRMARLSAQASDAAAQLVHVEVDVAQLQQRRPQLVLAAVGVLLDEALLLERPQQPVHGALGEPQPVAQLGHAEPARAAGEGPQDGGRTLDRLDCHASLADRSCRTVFDIVECRPHGSDTRSPGLYWSRTRPRSPRGWPRWPGEVAGDDVRSCPPAAAPTARWAPTAAGSPARYREADSGAGVVVLADIGSAVLSVARRAGGRHGRRRRRRTRRRAAGRGRDRRRGDGRRPGATWTRCARRPRRPGMSASSDGHAAHGAPARRRRPARPAGRRAGAGGGGVRRRRSR